MAGEADGGAGREKLAKSLDARSSFFLFDYYLQALESLGRAPEPSDGRDRAADAVKLLDRLRETASRCSELEFLGPEISDVQRLLAEKSGGGGGSLPADPVPLLGRCARRWFQRVRELPRRRNSLSVDIAFNLELAGMEDIAGDLYEGIACIDAGASRAARTMARRALDGALEKAGAPAGALEARLCLARRGGLVTPADVRFALANLGEGEGPGSGREGTDAGAQTAEWALEASVRPVKKLLRADIEAGLRRAMDPSGKRPAATAGGRSAPGAKFAD